MFITADSIDCVKAPIHMLGALNEKSYGIERGEILPSDLKELVKIAIGLLDTLFFPNINSITKDQSIIVLDILNPLLSDYVESSFELEKSIKLKKDESSLLVKELVDKTKIMVSTFISLVEDNQINEDDSFYANYLMEQVQESKKEREEVFGRKKLLELFD